MRTGIEKLRDKFEKDVKKLQSRCPHEASIWCREEWAIAHETGYEIKVCINCEKVLKRRKTKYY